MRKLPDGMRDKVLGAAELFAERGLDATKMEDVAVATGVPKATLYYHFAGKEDILAFLFHEILDEVERAVAAAAGGEGTAAARLRAVITAHLRVIAEHPAANRALQFDLGRAARTPLIDERIESAFRGPVRRLLEEGVADGSLRPTAHPRLRAVAILGALTTVGINALTVPRPRPVEEVADEVADLVLGGAAR